MPVAAASAVTSDCPAAAAATELEHGAVGSLASEVFGESTAGESLRLGESVFCDFVMRFLVLSIFLISALRFVICGHNQSQTFKCRLKFRDKWQSVIIIFCGKQTFLDTALKEKRA